MVKPKSTMNLNVVCSQMSNEPDAYIETDNVDLVTSQIALCEISQIGQNTTSLTVV